MANRVMKLPTQRDLQAENRRIQLLDIALALFAERGVENVSIKDLAAEADVAQGLIYYYFKSKDELLAAIFVRHNPLPEIQAIIAQLDGLPVQEGLLLFAQRLAQALSEKRSVIRLLMRELLSPRPLPLEHVLTFRQGVVTLLSTYLQQRMAAGEVREHDPLLSIHMLVSSLLILMVLDQPLEPYVPRLVETTLDGIRMR